jgi:hypothetical protein
MLVKRFIKKEQHNMPFVKGKFGRVVWKPEPVRSYKSKADAVKDYVRREKRWWNGHDGLSGDHYMYLTEFEIRERVGGAPTPVKFREVDEQMWFPWLHKTEKDASDGLCFTQRGGGKSTLMSGFVPLRTAIKKPGCQQVMTSDSVKTTAVNFYQKLKPMYESMHPEFRPSLKAAWPPLSEDDQIVEFGVRKRGKIDEGSGSIIKSIETAKGPSSPAKIEGEGVWKYYVDELMKHPFADDVFSRGGPLLKTYMKKEGSGYFFGSLSDKDARGRERAANMIKNSATLGLEVMFIDSSWVNPEIQMYSDRGELLHNQYTICEDENGYIDRKKAKEAILRNRMILEKFASPKVFLEYCLMYPLDLNELLEISSSEYWTTEEMAAANAQKAILEEADREENWMSVDQPAIVYRKNPSADIRKEKPIIDIKYGVNREMAKFFIFEEPKPGRTYGMGSDTIPFNTANENGSDSVSTVKCFDTNQYVAAYIDRHYDATHVGKNMINLQLMYSSTESPCLNLVEMNSIGAIKTAYETMGLFSWLANTPERFRPKTPAGFLQKGLNKDKNAAELVQSVRDYSVNNIDLMFFLRFFKEFHGFPFKNSDFMSSMAMTEMLHEEYKRLLIANKHKNKPRAITTSYGWNADGQRVLIKGQSNHIARDGTLDLSDIFKPIGK